jgi:hypothetical protein
MANDKFAMTNRALLRIFACSELVELFLRGLLSLLYSNPFCDSVQVYIKPNQLARAHVTSPNMLRTNRRTAITMNLRKLKNHTCAPRYTKKLVHLSSSVNYAHPKMRPATLTGDLFPLVIGHLPFLRALCASVVNPFSASIASRTPAHPVDTFGRVAHPHC